jgi:hypothetical protein
MEERNEDNWALRPVKKDFGALAITDLAAVISSFQID